MPFVPNPAIMKGDYTLTPPNLVFTADPMVDIAYIRSVNSPIPWTVALVKVFVPNGTPGEYDEVLPPSSYFVITELAQGRRATTAKLAFDSSKYHEETDVNLKESLTIAWLSDSRSEITIGFSDGTSSVLNLQFEKL